VCCTTGDNQNVTMHPSLADCLVCLGDLDGGGVVCCTTGGNNNIQNSPSELVSLGNYLKDGGVEVCCTTGDSHNVPWRLSALVTWMVGFRVFALKVIATISPVVKHTSNLPSKSPRPVSEGRFVTLWYHLLCSTP